MFKINSNALDTNNNMQHMTGLDESLYTGFKDGQSYRVSVKTASEYGPEIITRFVKLEYL